MGRRSRSQPAPKPTASAIPPSATCQADRIALVVIPPISGQSQGVLAIDCSTIGVAHAREIHEEARKAGAIFMEAPVSGGTEGARDGNLTFMIGGDAKHADRVTKILQPIGDYIAYVGGDGAVSTITLSDGPLIAAFDGLPACASRVL